jgi:hypothetical protein
MVVSTESNCDYFASLMNAFRVVKSDWGIELQLLLLLLCLCHAKALSLSLSLSLFRLPLSHFGSGCRCLLDDDFRYSLTQSSSLSPFDLIGLRNEQTTEQQQRERFIKHPSPYMFFLGRERLRESKMLNKLIRCRRRQDCSRNSRLVPFLSYFISLTETR